MAKPKIITGVDCDGVALEGIREVLNARLKETSALRSKALDWTDHAGVHDMRVASRRLRSVLGDFTPYIGKRVLNSSLKDIKTIGDALGEVRDEDVAIQGLEALAGKAPADVSTLLSEIVEDHKKSRQQKRKDLKHALRKSQLSQVESDFVAAVQSATSEPQARKRASKDVLAALRLSYQSIGRSILLEHIKDLEKRSNSLYEPFEVERLHSLRIAVKGLRYALEIFEPCWGRHLAFFAKKAAELQTSLGKLHDCDVWIESFGKRLADEKRKKEDTSDASAWLLSHFVELRTRHFKNSFRLWRDWESNSLSSRLTEYLKTGSRLALSPRSTAATKP